MIRIIKKCYSLSLGRVTVLGEDLKFTNEIEQQYIKDGLAEKITPKQTKEKKRNIKKK